MSDMGWWAVGLSSVCALLAVLVVVGYLVLREPRHQHEWTWGEAKPQPVYERDGWTGVRSQLPRYYQTDITGVCETCGEIRFEQHRGRYVLPKETA